ncbi:MAG TPA: hypothetical protein VIK55_06070 [Paludibacter sp.]
MKKYAMLALATAIMFSVTVSSQNQTPPPPGRKAEMKEFKQGERPQITPEKRAERMAKELGLSDAEKVKVQALFEKQDAKRDQHQAAVKKVRDEQKAQFETERKVQDAELETIIGKEKFQQLEKKRTEIQSRMKERREGNQRPQFGKRNHNNQFNPEERPKVSAQDRADKMAKKLSLTDLEKSKVQALFEKQDANQVQHQAEMKKIREEKKTQFEVERKAQGSELEKIIGTQKFQKLETERTDHQAKMNERRERNQRPGQGREWQKKELKQGNRPQMTSEIRADRMAKELGLVDAEKVKVQALFEKQDAKRDQLQAEVKKFREEQMTKFETERKAQDTELESIIGKEKFQKLVTLRTERQDKMEQRREKNPNDSTFKSKRGLREGKRMNEIK